MQKDRTYVCIDLKSFYASVECRERGLDPMTTNLVVADPERSDKTICLAVSPAMKKLGVPGRCRVFEIPKGIEYIMAPPRMQLYIDYSAEIYAIYLKYISKEDIHVYSIDEVFMDVTDYLAMYQMSAKELSVRIMEDILEHTGITATAGIGTNLYLAKVALDITAKHVEDHIGILDEESYCKTLWNHKPLTDFWRIGKGIANRLEQSGIRRMGEIAHADEDMLYRMFGVDAELLIDHAWGRESTTMQDIKSYRPKTNSLSSGQVLECDYTFEKGKLESEVLESNAIYNAETKTYLYRPRGLYDYGSTYEPYPEVVSYEKMDDGKIKLIINAVWERTMQDNAMTSELVIQPLDNNRFHYISNQVIKSNLDDTSKWYRNRLTYGEWNKIYKENDEIK